MISERERMTMAKNEYFSYLRLWKYSINQTKVFKIKQTNNIVDITENDFDIDRRQNWLRLCEWRGESEGLLRQALRLKKSFVYLRILVANIKSLCVVACQNPLI